MAAMLASEQNANHPGGHLTGHVARAQSAGNNNRRRSEGFATCRHGNDLDPEFEKEIHQFAEEKKRKTMERKDEDKWRESIKEQLEKDLNRRVREALKTPPGEVPNNIPTSHHRKQGHDLESLQQLNSHISYGDLQLREKESGDNRRWKVIQTKHKISQMINNGQMHFSSAFQEHYPNMGYFEELEAMQRDEYEQLIRSYANNHVSPDTSHHHGNRSQDFYDHLTNKAERDYGNLTENEKFEYFYAFTKNGFREALRIGRFPDGSQFELLESGKYKDKFGVIRDEHGPFWPPGYGPLYPVPRLRRETDRKPEPMVNPDKTDKFPTVESNPSNNRYSGKWRGVTIIYDSEKSVRDYSPREVSEGFTPSLKFESRFECGNLRQARRIGAFEYELVLKTDLYTTRHTQWYYFRVQGTTPGVTYKFKIINLHKQDSLYNHGMRPLIYSEKKAAAKNVGWERTGHHIIYTRNTSNLQCPLLARDRSYYVLEWQMEFQYGDDTCYLAHCYPYTFTDLRDDLDGMLADPERSKVMKRQVLCETRAGNSCFLVTVTNFDSDDTNKKAVIVTARVHPGETNSSWMMKGLLDYVTGSTITAKQLRNQFIFKIIPMLNPDGVIVGNYRCSLAGRDLNRNYRHPRKESFPTVWYTKAMMEDVSRYHEIILYCDLHGHSRKHNVFMYGCNLNARLPAGTTDSANSVSPENYLQERLFPWLMSQKSPDKFWFRGCKFQVKKCKEATGRVVMFRQMNITNSFTMEATFCGTTICRGEQRHFNTFDYQDMGQVFCEVVLEYHQIQQNKARQSEVILELTRAITQQILETRGLLPNNVPDITTEVGKQQIQVFSVDKNSGSDQIASTFIAMVTKDKSHPPTIAANQYPAKDREAVQQPDFSKMDVSQLLDTMSSQTIDGCAQLLEQLHIAESIAESDSSDSDSESEPEMKFVDTKPRRRKKKNKKKRQSFEGEAGDKSKVSPTQHAQVMGMTNNTQRPKADVKNGLPAIDGDQKRTKHGSNSGKNSRHVVRVNYPSFVNKYTGRSNGGIPCFSEERLLERASKRVRNMKKKLEEEAHQRESGYYITMTDDDLAHIQTSSPDNLTMAPFQRIKPQNDLHQTDLKRQFHDMLQCGSAPSDSRNIRVGYMHAGADSGGQSGHDNTPLAVISTNAMTRPLTDSSDSSDGDDLDESTHMALTAMRTPYQNLCIPAQTGMIYSHRAKLGRLPALTHKMTTENSCSIPRRHSISTNMMVTSLSAGNEKSESNGFTSKLSTTRIEGTASDGNTNHISRHGHYRKTLNNYEKQAADGLLCPQGTALGLMSREYTELLLHRLRSQKSQRSSNLGNMTTISTPATTTTGSRHSTCE